MRPITREERDHFDFIFAQAADVFHVDRDSLMRKTNVPRIAQPRSVALAVARVMLPKLRLRQLANMVEAEDHSMVIKAIRRVKILALNEREFGAKANEVWRRCTEALGTTT